MNEETKNKEVKISLPLEIEKRIAGMVMEHADESTHIINHRECLTNDIRTLLADFQKEQIICAAVKFKDEKIWICRRHADAIHKRAARGVDVTGRVEGFMTSRNRFVDRKEGRKIQEAAGIPSANKLGYFDEELYSEDLY